jgi:adhesin HecA-like repeat protein
MRGVKANAQTNLWTGIHDHAQMLEAMADTFSLSRRVFQKNPQLSQIQPADGKLNTVAALANSGSFIRSTGAARVHDQVVDAKQDCPFNFFAKGSARLLQYEFVGSSEVYEIVAMNDDGFEFS